MAKRITVIGLEINLGIDVHFYRGIDDIDNRIKGTLCRDDNGYYVNENGVKHYLNDGDFVTYHKAPYEVVRRDGRIIRIEPKISTSKVDLKTRVPNITRRITCIN